MEEKKPMNKTEIPAALSKTTGLTKQQVSSQRFPIQLSEVDLEDADLVVALKKAEHYDMMVSS